jgi:hypothetical protein
MRGRHRARLCRACQAPMARQEDSCWRCGSQWATEDVPRPALRLITGGAPTESAGAPDSRIAGEAAVDARRATQSDLDADRWMSDGGALAVEAAVPLGAPPKS